MSVSVTISSFPGADVGAKMAAYAALPAQGGEIIVDLGGSFAMSVVFDVSGKAAILTGFGNALPLTYTGSGPAFTFNNGPAFDFCSRFEEFNGARQHFEFDRPAGWGLKRSRRVDYTQFSDSGVRYRNRDAVEYVRDPLRTGNGPRLPKLGADASRTNECGRERPIRSRGFR